MLRVGLTGNIGSGKSTVTRIFSALGVPVYHADEEARKFLTRPEVISAIASRFGTGVVSETGEIRRRALATAAFADAESITALNAILHPLVRTDAREWSLNHNARPYVVHEAAIIFESGFKQEYDRIIYIACPRETALLRVMERDGATREEVLRRLEFQWPDEDKVGECDYVIENDGRKMLVPQVVRIHRELSENPGSALSP